MKKITSQTRFSRKKGSAKNHCQSCGEICLWFGVLIHCKALAQYNHCDGKITTNISASSFTLMDWLILSILMQRVLQRTVYLNLNCDQYAFTFNDKIVLLKCVCAVDLSGIWKCLHVWRAGVCLHTCRWSSYMHIHTSHKHCPSCCSNTPYVPLGLGLFIYCSFACYALLKIAVWFFPSTTLGFAQMLLSQEWHQI